MFRPNIDDLLKNIESSINNFDPRQFNFACESLPPEEKEEALFDLATIIFEGYSTHPNQQPYISAFEELSSLLSQPQYRDISTSTISRITSILVNSGQTTLLEILDEQVSTTNPHLMPTIIKFRCAQPKNDQTPDFGLLHDAMRTENPEMIKFLTTRVLTTDLSSSQTPYDLLETISGFASQNPENKNSSLLALSTIKSQTKTREDRYGYQKELNKTAESLFSPSNSPHPTISQKLKNTQTLSR